VNGTALQIDNLVAGYGSAEILHGISFSLSEGEAISIVGRNGAGKTTALRSIAGQIPVRSGTKRLFGVDVNSLDAHAISRRGLAYVPEDRQIFATLTVVQNLKLGAYAHAPKEWNIDRVFEFFPRLKDRHNALGGSLSGGEQQMLALGRALMSDPKVLLLDEPTEGLAPIVVDQVMESLQQIIGTGVSSILVEQNLRVPRRLATRHIVLDNGEVVWTGSSAELQENADAIHRVLSM
jgi:branched-chain amino acid transport system ATP-binding protein